MIYGIIALAVVSVILIVVCIRQHLKINRLLKAIKDTNESLNETREMVSKHEKSIRRAGLYQNR